MHNSSPNTYIFYTQIITQKTKLFCCFCGVFYDEGSGSCAVSLEKTIKKGNTYWTVHTGCTQRWITSDAVKKLGVMTERSPGKNSISSCPICKKFFWRCNFEVHFATTKEESHLLADKTRATCPNDLILTAFERECAQAFAWNNATWPSGRRQGILARFPAEAFEVFGWTNENLEAATTAKKKGKKKKKKKR